MIFFLVGTFLTRRARNRLDDLLSTEGTVVGTQRCGTDTYAAVIEYFDDENLETFQFTTESCSNPAPKVGNSITVLYDPENPGYAVSGSFVALWLAPIVLLVLGVIFSCAFGFIICKLCSSNGEQPQMIFQGSPSAVPGPVPMYNASTGATNYGDQMPHTNTHNSTYNSSPGYVSSNPDQYTASDQFPTNPASKPQNGGTTSIFDQLKT